MSVRVCLIAQRDLVAKYGVMQAPTMVLLEGDSVRQFRGVSDIKGWFTESMRA